MINGLIGNLIKKNISSILIFLVVVCLAGYGYLRTTSLENQVAEKTQRIERINEQYNELSEETEAISNEFNVFVNKVNRDLSEQRDINERIRNNTSILRDRVSDLRDTFETSADGTPRDYRMLIDDKASLIERMTNDATRELSNEFEEISR